MHWKQTVALCLRKNKHSENQWILVYSVGQMLLFLQIVPKGTRVCQNKWTHSDEVTMITNIERKIWMTNTYNDNNIYSESIQVAKISSEMCSVCVPVCTYIYTYMICSENNYWNSNVLASNFLQSYQSSLCSLFTRTKCPYTEFSKNFESMWRTPG